jgi:hypothetical protein
MRNKRKVNAAKGTQGFVETEKAEPREASLSHSAYNSGSMTLVTKGQITWSYYDTNANHTWYGADGVPRDAPGRKGWGAKTDNGATLDVSNDGRSTIGWDWTMTNADGVEASGRVDDIEAAIELAGEQARWGVVGVGSNGSYLATGRVSSVEHIAPGIARVKTSRANGILLSAERNAAMPADLRDQTGIYRDEDEPHVRLAFPEAFVSPDNMFRGVPNSEAVMAVREDANDAIAGMLPPV